MDSLMNSTEHLKKTFQSFSNFFRKNKNKIKKLENKQINKKQKRRGHFQIYFMRPGLP